MYNFDSIYNYDNAVDATVNSSIIGGLFIGIMIFSLLLSLISIVSYWKLFTKAGKPGWASIIPIYNVIVMLQIAEMSLINLLLFLIPIVNIIVFFKMNINIAKHFGKSSAFGVGITLIPIIFIPILAFSDNKVSEANINDSNDFNASSVINKQGTGNPVDIEEVPVAPVINIETTNSDAIDASKATNNIENPINDNVIENNEITTTAVENQIEPAPMSINAESAESNLEVNNIYSNNESIKNEEIQVNSTLESEPINAFNSKPIESMQDNSNEINQVSDNKNEQPIDIFGTGPANLENNNTSLKQSNVIAEPTHIENLNITEAISTSSDKKICKSCGSEMPVIVSICPKCGTDNE